MGKILVVMIFLVCNSVFASTNEYDLKMDLSINGKHVSSPRVIAKEGETTSMTQDSNGEKIFMDVIATEQVINNKQSILMKFVIGRFSETGERTILSTPQIITIDNKRAQITVGDKQEKEDLALSVIATRKAL